MTKLLAAFRRSRNAAGMVQPLLLFLMGVGFLVIGVRSYPAFIGVGGLFLFISYRGFTCRVKKTPEQK